MKFNILTNIPKPIKHFLLKSLLVFVVWKLLYHLILYPARVPDSQLTHITAVITKKLIQFHYPDSVIRIEKMNAPLPREILLMNNKKIVGIADGCNGLELYILYIGFLICFPASVRKLLLYTAIGLLSIFVLNNIRSYIITLLNINNSSYSDVAHHYLFKIFIYGVMFFSLGKIYKNND
jgi:exosortase/archaeosortase family protein